MWVKCKSLFKRNHQSPKHNYPTVYRAEGFSFPRILVAVTEMKH